MSSRSLARPLLVGITLLTGFALSAPTSANAWGPVRTLTSHGYSASQHALAVSGSAAETAYIDGGLKVRHSIDGGASWGAPKLIESTAPSAQVGFTQVALSGSHVMALYERQDSLQTNFRLYVRRSADGGTTWSSRILMASATNWMVLASAAVAITGSDATVAWTDGTTGAIRSRHSADGGRHWAAARTLGATNFHDNKYDGYVQLTAASGRMYLTWLPDQTTQGMATGVVMRRSTDGGQTFGPRTWLTADALQSRGSVRVAASGNRLLAVYQRAAGQLASARSSNGGVTVQTRDLTQGSSYPQAAVAMAAATVRLAVVGNDGRIYLRSSTDGGAHWTPLSQVATPVDAASGLSVGVGPHGTVVTWQESDLYTSGPVHSRFRS